MITELNVRARLYRMSISRLEYRKKHSTKERDDITHMTLMV